MYLTYYRKIINLSKAVKAELSTCQFDSEMTSEVSSDLAIGKNSSLLSQTAGYTFYARAYNFFQYKSTELTTMAFEVKC